MVTQPPARMPTAASGAGPSSVSAPLATVDNLTRIRAIDPMLRTKLVDLGVTNYRQIAGWLPGDVARVSKALGVTGRIEQENWIEQAQILARGGETEYSRRIDRGEVVTAMPTPGPGIMKPDMPAPAMPSPATAAPAPAIAAATAAVAMPKPAAPPMAAPPVPVASPEVAVRAAFAQQAKPAMMPAAVATPAMTPPPVAPSMPMPAVKPPAPPVGMPVTASAVTAAVQAAVKATTMPAAPAPAAAVPAAMAPSPVTPTVTTIPVPATPMAMPGMAAATASAAAAGAVPAAAATGRDNLQRISGINAEVEKLLNVQGYSRYAQIASWTPADATRIDRMLGYEGRVAKESWIEQSALLSRGGDTAFSRQFDHRASGAGAAAAAKAASATPAMAPAAAADTPRLSRLADSVRDTAAPAAGAASEPSPRASDMSSLRSVRSEAYTPQGGTRTGPPEDLKRIRGVGVLIEKKLLSMGITSYAQIANWSNADVDRVSNVLDFKGRIERENWIEQARILSAGGQTEFSRRVDRGEVGH